MTRFTALVIIIALRISFQPGAVTEYAKQMVPFAKPAKMENTPAKFIDFRGATLNNKVLLQWEIGENETADQFEVEKSTDGKNYVMAALVFGTDEPDNASYKFYENKSLINTSYRIKMINKNKQVEYSNIVIVRS